MSERGFQRYSVATLLLNSGVIAWGAYVRATGSGAGCGRHWPICNGQVIPRTQRLETWIEFSHRVSSGLALLFVAGLAVWAFSSYPRHHPVRRAAVFSVAFMVTEAALGAGLVLFQLVAHDSSLGRAVAISLHLVNTFFLLAALAVVVVSARTGLGWKRRPLSQEQWWLVFSLTAVVVLGVTGALNALGDTLFPARTLKEGLAQDLTEHAPLLIRLRVLHPVVATLSAALLCITARLVYLKHASARALAITVAALVMAQWMVGWINLRLLAPTGMQLLHLVLADATWIALVMMAWMAVGGLPEGSSPRVGGVE